jgi:hypothetical protein
VHACPHRQSTSHYCAESIDEEGPGGVCPLSEEPYTAEGPRQPVFLPECGHTFSRESVETLIASLPKGSAARVTCPLCNRVQPDMRSARACHPNWDTIQRVLVLEKLNENDEYDVSRDSTALSHSTLPSAPPRSSSAALESSKRGATLEDNKRGAVPYMVRRHSPRIPYW